VETDETYIGGLAKNMHVVDRKRKIHGTGGTDKVAIHGALERGGPVVATVIDSVSAKTLQESIRAWVESGATVYTDQATAYVGWECQVDSAPPCASHLAPPLPRRQLLI